MDMNSLNSDYVETLENSLKDTESYIVHVLENYSKKKGLVYPIITPRYLK